MQLTQAQKTSIKAHIVANTNLATRSDGATFVINTRPASRNADDQQAIANWYNGTALAGDNQPFANLILWNPNVSIAQLNSAINWTDNPFGADQPTVSNSWAKWQSMIWAMRIDMSDPQVRQGVLLVWTGSLTPAGGAAGIQTPINLGAVAGTMTGKIAGRRVELVVSPAPVGAVASVWAAAHVCPTNVIGQTLTQQDVDDLELNG